MALTVTKPSLEFYGKKLRKAGEKTKRAYSQLNFEMGKICLWYLSTFISLLSSQSSVCPLSRSPGSQCPNLPSTVLEQFYPNIFYPTVFHVPKLNTFSHHNLKNNDPTVIILRAIVLSVLPIRLLRQRI